MLANHSASISAWGVLSTRVGLWTGQYGLTSESGGLESGLWERSSRCRPQLAEMTFRDAAPRMPLLSSLAGPGAAAPVP